MECGPFHRTHPIANSLQNDWVLDAICQFSYDKVIQQKQLQRSRGLVARRTTRIKTCDISRRLPKIAQCAQTAQSS